MTLDQPQNQPFLAFQESMLSVRKPRKWLKLLFGRSNIGIRGAIHNAIEFWKLRRRISSRGNDLASTPYPSHPRKNDLPGDLMRIVEKGRLVTLFQSRFDPGYDLLCSFASSQLKKMCQAGQMKIVFLPKRPTTTSTGSVLVRNCDRLSWLIYLPGMSARGRPWSRYHPMAAACRRQRPCV